MFLLLELLDSGEIESLEDLLERADVRKSSENRNTELTVLPISSLKSSLGTFYLTPDQESALSQLKKFTHGREKFFRLTGFAGTGKTFLSTQNFR